MRFRGARDELFRTHPQSPIEPEERDSFPGLRYFDTDPACRVTAHVEPGDDTELVIDTGGEDGAVRYRRVGRLVFTLAGPGWRLTALRPGPGPGGPFLPLP